MHLTNSYVIVNIQKGPSYGDLTTGNINYFKHPGGYGPDWRKANDIESALYYANTLTSGVRMNMVLALKHL